MKKFGIRVRVVIVGEYFKTFEAEDAKDAESQAKLDLTDQTPEQAGWELDEREVQKKFEWVEEI